MTETPLAIRRRIHAHLANIGHSHEGWAETAAHLTEEYHAELAATVIENEHPTEDEHQAALTAAITRYEESLTDVS